MRKINEIIIHCTATPEGRAVSLATIRKWHKDRGWGDIGYHYVVHLDGKIEKGRPIEKVGAHVVGRNTGTIGVVYVGGTTSKGAPKDTRTPAQKKALEGLFLDLMARFSTINQISGHNQYANKACPCFDADAEYRYLMHGGPDQPLNIMPALPRGEPVPINDEHPEVAPVSPAPVSADPATPLDKAVDTVGKIEVLKRQGTILGAAGLAMTERLTSLPPMIGLLATAVIIALAGYALWKWWRK